MNHAEPGPARSASNDATRNVVAALPLLAVMPVVAWLASAVGSLGGTRFSTAAAFTVLATLVLAGFVALTRKSRPRAGLLAACHALVWSVGVALGAGNSITDPIVAGPMRCGTGEMAFLVFAAPIAGLITLLVGVALGAGVANRRSDPLVRSLATALPLLALALFSFELVSVGRPDPDTYVASLTVERELAPDTSVTFEGREYRYVRERPVSRASEIASGMADPSALVPHLQCSLHGLGEVESFYMESEECHPIRIRADRAHDIAVVDQVFSDPRYIGERYAFRPSTGLVTEILPATVADHITVPIGWLVGAGLGGLLALGFAASARRLRRRASDLHGVDATHLGGGLVELANRETLRVDAATNLLVGDVVLDDEREPAPTYRVAEMPTFGTARQGTVATLRGALTDLAASLDGIAIASATLGMAPLVMARLVAGL